jgi:hypothetical protein
MENPCTGPRLFFFKLLLLYSTYNSCTRYMERRKTTSPANVPIFLSFKYLSILFLETQTSQREMPVTNKRGRCRGLRILVYKMLFWKMWRDHNRTAGHFDGDMTNPSGRRYTISFVWVRGPYGYYISSPLKKRAKKKKSGQGNPRSRF